MKSVTSEKIEIDFGRGEWSVYFLKQGEYVKIGKTKNLF